MKVQLIDVDETNWRACAAVKLALEEMCELGAKDIVTSCVPENIRVRALYKKLGFVSNGKLEGGDIFLRLPAEHAC